MQNPSFYDLFAVGTETLAKRQRFFLKETKNSKSIIEIGAGTGNLSLYLADNNINVTCVEPSPAVVINLSAKIFGSAKYRQKVTLIPKQLDQVDFNGKKFDGVIISNVTPYINDFSWRILFLISS